MESEVKLIAARKRCAEPVAWMHVQGNHFDPSLRQLDDDEKARGWTQFPLYGPDGVAAAPTELWDAIAELVVACGGSVAHFDEAIADRVDAAARGVAPCDDTARLDWLDAVNRRANERNGTTCGWKFDLNHNRASLSDHNLPALSVRAAIDAAIHKGA